MQAKSFLLSSLLIFQIDVESKAINYTENGSVMFPMTLKLKIITEIYFNKLLFPEFITLQKRLKQSLHRTWKNALRHDWIPEEVAKSLPVLEFYTGVRWTKMVKALKNYKKKMTSIYDIFNVIDSDKEPEPQNIFIEGK